MKCRSKEVFDYYILTPENADHVLDLIGFGKEKCVQTYEHDHRYGRVTTFGIEYGFEYKMHGKCTYGTYIVFVYDYTGAYEFKTKEEFFDQYEPIK